MLFTVLSKYTRHTPTMTSKPERHQLPTHATAPPSLLTSLPPAHLHLFIRSEGCHAVGHGGRRALDSQPGEAPALALSGQREGEVEEGLVAASVGRDGG
jgi:hypothetical protein